MFEQKTIGEVMNKLRCNSSSGLAETEAESRLKDYGENIFASEKNKSIAVMLLEQLNEPLIFVLFVAAAISMLLREFSDTIIILIVIITNAIVGVVQEGKAMKALEALKKLTSPIALVKRDNKYLEIPVSKLVPGDLVCLEAGRQVPADLRLVWSNSLKIEEASLTGESVPVQKNAKFVAEKDIPLGDRANMAYMSTNVIYGRGEGIVAATGMSTEIGKIAGMINGVSNEITPLQKRLADLGKLLSAVAIFLCIALFAIAVMQKRDILEMLITAISLAVAAVPEGLPAVVTIVLALSVSRMVKVNTIVRRLPSVETLGAVSVVCTDKTGTLTQNKMTVTECFIDGHLIAADQLEVPIHRTLLEGFILCNDARIDEDTRIGDPTELALLGLSGFFGFTRDVLEVKMPRIDEIPFDSRRKMMTTVHGTHPSAISYTKGSGDVILKRCTHILINQKTVPITNKHQKEIEQAMSYMAGNALRVLALALKRGSAGSPETGLTFVGLAGMMDPARPEAAEAIQLFRKAKVKTVMITGDHVDTAFAIASKLDIASDRVQCITGEQLQTLSDNELAEKAKILTVFARVSPEHKVRIVKAYRSLGNIVAMTGDGVNDAPSLKAADIGIAMGMNGTDVAKNAADLILTDDNFATIERAIEEGRGIYENIKKSVLFLLSSNFGEIITMFISIILGFASPLKASHILWINLITDSLPALALGVDKNKGSVMMSRPPRNAKESLFAHGGFFCTLFYGTLIAVISLVAFLTLPYIYLMDQGLPFTISNIATFLKNGEMLARSQTYAFTVLGISQLFHAIGMKDMETSIFRMNPLSNKLMLIAFAAGFLLQVSVTEIPYLITMFGTAKLSFNEWGRLVFLAAMPLLAHEVLLFQPFRWLKSLTLPNFHKGQDY